jgi:hypothetical protein
MLDLWDALGKELGSAFIRQFGSPSSEAFEHWLVELWEFTPEQLFAGFEKFKKSGSTYISLNVFRKHCQPSPAELGIDGFDEAYRKTIAKKWSELHPAFPVLCASVVYDLRNQTAQESRRRFKEIYDNVIQRVSGGEVFEWTPNTVRIEKFQKKTLTERDKQAGRRVLDELKKEFK